MRDYKDIHRQWQSFLNEATYGEYKGQKRVLSVPNLKLVIDIEDMRLGASDHAEERRFRHRGQGGGGGFTISKDSIVKAVDKAIGEVMNDFANGELRNGERFLIVDESGKGDPLNVLCALQMREGQDTLTVITVMRKSGFATEGMRRYVVR
jgi:hypothetical protein